jgi:hypothetical protein
MGFAPRVPSGALAGRSLQLVIFDDLDTMETRGFRAFYSIKPVSEDDTINTFIDSGGIVIRESGTLGVDYAAIMNPTKRKVQIGPYDASLVWQNADSSSGIPPYSIHWSDGIVDYEVLAGVSSPGPLVDFLRTIYC